MHVFLLLGIFGSGNGHDIFASFQQTENDIVDFVAYSKCLHRCSIDVACSGISLDSDSQCHLVRGSEDDGTPITIIEVNFTYLHIFYSC